MQRRILIIENKIVLANDLAGYLKDLGYEVAGKVYSAEEAVRAVEETRPNLVLMDINLPWREIDGIEAAARIRSRFDIPVVYLAGFSAKDALERAKRTEPYGYLSQPVALAELKSTVETALYKHEADKRVRANEERFRLLYENAPLPYQSLDEQGRFLEVNQSWLDTLGYSREEVIGKWFGDFLAPGYAERFKVKFPRFIAVGEVHGVEFEMIKKGGSKMSAAFHGRIGRDQWGNFKQTHCILHDITELKQSQRAREEAEAETRIRNRILEAFLTLPDDQVYGEVLEIILEVTGSSYGTFGYFNQDGVFVVPFMTGQIYWDECRVPEKEIVFKRGFFGGIWAKSIQEKRTLYCNHGPFNTPEGHIAITNTMATPIVFRGEVISAIHVANKPTGYDEDDVRTLETVARGIAPVLNARLERDKEERGRKKAEDQTRASLREKEVLLREIHHRVKNNLALVNSLLSLPAEYATAKTPREMFEEVKSRIRSMAVAHEILYQSENLACLSVRDYIGNLLYHILSAHGSIGSRVIIDKEIEDVSFGLDTAIPLGFLLTELLSNCFKHAFPEGSEGKINVSLRSVNEHELELMVADNGVGIPESVDWRNPRSMGFELIDTFVEQLDGRIEIDRSQGTEVRIRFKEIGDEEER